jgi:hypothetical protein
LEYVPGENSSRSVNEALKFDRTLAFIKAILQSTRKGRKDRKLTFKRRLTH